MSELGSIAFSASAMISECTTLGGVGNLFEQSIRRIGLTCAASGMVTGRRAASNNPFHFVNWPLSWLEFYKESGFLKIDPIPRYAIISGMAVTWSDVVARLPPRDPGRKVIEAAKAAGFTEGLAIPLRNARGDLGLVSVGGDRPRLAQEEIDYIKVISSAAFQISTEIDESADIQLPPTRFTDRELDCISLLSQGFTDSEIAATIGLAATTVSSHVENAKRKAGARSRAHLVAIAMSSKY